MFVNDMSKAMVEAYTALATSLGLKLGPHGRGTGHLPAVDPVQGLPEKDEPATTATSPVERVR
jgi:hypothetical protein